MFPAEVYIERRKKLAQLVQSGVLLFLGNANSPINYQDNVYPFRQDSSFLYYWGLNCPDLAAVLDVDEGVETVFGNELTSDELIWWGQQVSLKEAAAAVGIRQVRPFQDIESLIEKVLQGNRTVHFLPQYRVNNGLKILRWLNIPLDDVPDRVSRLFIKSVVAQRSVKSEAEIEEIEKALSTSHAMHVNAMRMTSPGMYELEIVGAMESTAYANGGCRMAYPPIFTVRGEVLHNRFHTNRMNAGDLAINDSGAESPLLYASDITRTIPVAGRFSDQQKEIYSTVLHGQETAIKAMRPGIEFRKIHWLASKALTEGLQQVGLMKGDIESSVRAGAHALFFPHGIGHMMGLDVHDMEGLGEDLVGYSDDIRRSDQFGLSNLRFARALKAGFVLTVEPGIYFIPQLMDRWRAEKKHESFIRYEALDAFKGFGGIRIEDDLLITQNGCRVLGKPIPKTIEDVETYSGHRTDSAG